MEYITTKEASEKWGISTIRITVLANEGRIPGAQHLGRSWLIPATATKPPELKANHSVSAKKKTKAENHFSFPLYHFRSDWSYIKETQLTEQEQLLMLAETAVLECRFTDAYPILESLLQHPCDITIEIGCLWNTGICCIALNKPEEFSKIFLRLQLIMAEDFPHHDDLLPIIDTLKTYKSTLATTANDCIYYTDIHEQSLPMACLLAGYSQLSKEVIAPNSTDANLSELILRLINNTGAVIVIEFLHFYILGIYYLRDNMTEAEKHAKLAVQIAFENKFYFPLVTYYRYFIPILDPIIAQYPEDFQNHCQELVSQYDKNLTAFLSSIDKFSVISKLTDADFPYIYAVLMNLSNTAIAERMNTSTRTVNRRLDAIFKMLGMNNKKELREYLKNNI